MRKNTRREDPAQAVAQWNAAVQVGDTVEYREVSDAQPQRFTTRTPAEVLSGHTAVVWLNGKSGCVCISHCTPVPAAAAAPLEVDILYSERGRCFVIQGHVDLVSAAAAMQAADDDTTVPAPRHTWMHDTDVPEGEDADWWRHECTADAQGAEPVTMSWINE